MTSLHTLARAAGIEIHWRDVNGIDHTVSDDSLRAVLAAIGFPAGSDRKSMTAWPACARRRGKIPCR